MKTPMGANIIDPDAYARNAQAVNQMSEAYRTAVASSGQFNVSQMRLRNPVESFTEDLERQRISATKLRGSMQMLKAAYREQLALRQASIASWGRDSAGNLVADMAVPNQVHKSWDTLSQRIGFTREVLRSASTQMINFGKNTQWAGRQLMVGFTMPVAAFGAATGMLAYKADEQMTRIVKVYDARSQDIIARENELQSVRAASMDTAANAARSYGSAMEDTLDVQAELAAQGLTGVALQETTNQVMRIAALGEVDRADAMKASIALQQTLNATTNQTAEAMNYMNAVENATSLATADFAKAMPIALGPLREMSAEGATSTEVMQNLGVLLVAMRQQGIEAGEGANAIKAMMSRLYRPSVQVRKEWQKIAGIDLMGMVSEAGGDVMKILPQIAEALEGMPKAERNQLLAGLFGTYQVARMNAMLDGITEMNQGIGQTARVLEVNRAGTQAWSDMAQNEMGRKMVSASGRFQASLQTLKVELADMGEPFLEMGVQFLDLLTGLATRFNSLSDGTKEWIARLAILAAVVGPIIMLSGLFLNFVGHIGKAAVAMTWIAGRMRLIDREGVLAKAAMDLMGRGFTTASTAAGAAAAQVDVLNAAITRARTNASVPIPPVVGAGAVGTTAARGAGVTGVGGGIVPMAMPPTWTSNIDDINTKLERTKNSTGEVDKNVGRGANKLHRFGGFAGTAAAGLAAMALFSNQGADGMGKFVMQAALLAPLLMMIPWGGMVTGFVKGLTAVDGRLMKVWKGTEKVTGRAAQAGWRGVASGAARLGATFLRFIGPAGWIATAVIGLGTIYSKINDAAEATERLTNSGKEWADVLGFQHKEVTIQTNDKALNETFQNLEAAAKVREMLPDMVNEMRDVGTESARAVDIAMTQGFQVLREGGTRDQAKKAVELALLAAFPEDQEFVRDVMIRINPKFKTNRSALRAEAEVVRRDIATAMNNAAEKTGAEGFWDSIFGDPDDLNEDGKARAAGVGRIFANSLAGAADEIEMTSMFDKLESQFNEASNKLLLPLKEEAPGVWRDFQDLGLGSAKALAAEYERVQFAEWGPDLDIRQQIERGFRHAGVSLDDFIAKTNQVSEAQVIMLRRVAEFMNLDPEIIKNINTVRDLTKAAGFSYVSIADAQADYNSMVKEGVIVVDKMGKHREDLTKQERLAALNQQRVAAGLERTTVLADGFKRKVTETKNEQKDVADAVDDTTDAQKRLNREQNRRTAAWKEMDFAGKYRESMEATMSDVAEEMTADLEREEERTMAAIERRQERRVEEFDLATERREAQFDREMSQLEGRQERAMRQFENNQAREQRQFDDRWEDRNEKLNQGYDERIDRIQKAIDAEEHAESVRQRIFEAEMTRIQRMAETTSKNIDFNIALNSGDLDEAARITNEMAANEGTWALEDAGRAGQNRTERRTNRLQGRIDAIEQERETRMEALADMEERHRLRLEREQDREKRAFEKTQARERRALELDRERWQKRNENHREAMEEQFENTKETAEREFRVRRANLDKALEALQRYIPRNRKELVQHIRVLGGDYDEFGRQLKERGDNWSQHIGRMLKSNIKESARAIRNEIDWAAVGERAAAGMISGAFGMNLNEFKRWVGIDSGRDPARGDDAGAVRNTGRDLHGRDQRFHSGGPVNGAARGGIARGTRPYPSETMARLKNDEYVVSGKAHRTYGTDFFNSINKGEIKPNTDGPGTGGIGTAPLGMVGALAGGMVSTFRGMMQSVIAQKGAEYQAAQAGAGEFAAGKPGEYGGRFFGKEQLRNAAIIASVGSRMGMSERDIKIGIMTAITESGLVNVAHGDRDSLGLFQQRPSQGWGSPAQVQDPEYAARKFFSALKKINNRDSITPWIAAQSVQRSFDPTGSNYRQYWDDAQGIFGRGLTESTIAGVVSGGNKYPGVEPVSPWVREAAEYLGAMHNVGVIGGYRPSSAVANSDHPRGLALDLMTRTFQQGDAIARTVQQMWKELDVTYMIWKQRIKSTPNGPWRRMDDRGSATANHMDHVHLSFEKGGNVSGLLRSGQAGEMAMGPGGKHRPVRGGRQSQGIHGSPPAIDISLPSGRPVYAAHDGRVVTSTDLRGREPRAPHGGLGYRSYGRYIEIQGGDVGTLYAHLSQRYAQRGQRVTGGTKIGLSGNTGYSFGDHLHFGASGRSPYAFVPGLRDGGNIRWDNTLANLHKNETVLTAPLSRELEEGIGNLATGGGNVYNEIHVHPTPGMDEDALARKVAAAIEQRKGRVGRSRNVGGK